MKSEGKNVVKNISLLTKKFSHVTLELSGIPWKDLKAFAGKSYIFPILEKEKHSNCVTFPRSNCNESSVAEMF